jgi:putative PIN family toxin of toxin-antitoxin system
MLNVILDTNVFISAILFIGRLNLIYWQVLEGDYKICVCSELEQEVKSKFVDKFGANLGQLHELDTMLDLAQKFKLPNNLESLSLRDAKDEFLLHLADVSKAELLVTGDKDLLSLPNRNWKQIYILTPKEFLDFLTKTTI